MSTAIERGRESFERLAWGEAFSQYSAADQSAPLEADDHELRPCDHRARLTAAGREAGRHGGRQRLDEALGRLSSVLERQKDASSDLTALAQRAEPAALAALAAAAPVLLAVLESAAVAVNTSLTLATLKSTPSFPHSSLG